MKHAVLQQYALGARYFFKKQLTRIEKNHGFAIKGNYKVYKRKIKISE